MRFKARNRSRCIGNRTRLCYDKRRDRFASGGGLAQLEERIVRNDEAGGSSPLPSGGMLCVSSCWRKKRRGRRFGLAVVSDTPKPLGRTLLSDAVKAYKAEIADQLLPRTRAAYNFSIDLFVEGCKVKYVEDIGES